MPMSFPVYLEVLDVRIHPHLLAELVAYPLSFQLYLRLRRTPPFRETSPPFERMMWVIVGALFGAMLGSKVLAWLESPGDYFASPLNPQRLIGGKTIVGGLLGGWAGVEVAKTLVGIRTSTGDACVFPLMLGMAVGRVGCFLTGLSDRTHGVFTSLPWGVDFGDGPRHPAQLYEIAFLAILALGLALWFQLTRPTSGLLFRGFLLGYLAFRFGIEFLKPSEKPYAGLSAIQLASAAGGAMCLWSTWRMRGIR
jgi:phosphatidylglycerol:prolipoprotein diacylglycerol transferase